MRIGVSARWLDLPAGGAREYLLWLLKYLLMKDGRNDYVVFHSQTAHLGSFPAAREILLPGRNKLVWDYFSLPRAVVQQHIDVFWTPSYIVPFPIRCKSVATVHDLAYLTMPRSYEPLDVLYMRLAMPGSFRRANSLICVSEHTRRELMRLFPFVQEKATVIYHGISPRYRERPSAETMGQVLAKYSLTRPYIFYAGSISPRKGLGFLLQAFAVLKRHRGIPQRLVLTGGWTWGQGNLRHLIESLELKDQVSILGHVQAEDMPALYRMADLFVYPSLYEGFGLPVLEAMACECPVVSTCLTSLPEVCGEAALMVDPRAVKEFADAIEYALADPQTRTRLKQKGTERAAQFTWEATADKTLQVFEKVGRA